MGSLKHFVWAIDAQEADAKVNKVVARYLRALTKNISDSKVTPCSLLPLGDFGFHEVLTSREIKEYKKRQQEMANKVLRRAGFQDSEVDIVVAKERSMSHLIQYLTRYVKKVEGDLAVLGTHQKSASERFFLGSFSENFLFHGKTPTLMIPPQTKVPTGGLKKAMVSMDLLDDYRKDFQKVLAYAESFGIKELFLYHGVPISRIHHYHPGFVEEKVQEREKCLESLKKQARGKGIKATTFVSDGEIDLAADIIHHGKKNKCQLIFLKGKTSKAKSIFLGSTARSILRQTTTPCLLY